MALPVRRATGVSPEPLQRSDPFRELEELRERMERLMQSLWSAGGSGAGFAWMPPADIEETDEAWIIEAELPGVDKKDVAVELHDSELIISGELKERERRGILRRQTRRTGQFEYRVTLPATADHEHIDAHLHDGVLTVRVPKSQTARPRRIEVRS